jgi:glutathione S-transferase
MGCAGRFSFANEEHRMKLYYHPASTTSRPVLHFIAENNIPVELQVIDLFTGEQLGDAYRAVNPSQLVPTLEDGDFRLTESSAILKYLADTIDSPAYPKDLRQRARVNELMDWFNTQLCRDLAYGSVYPQIFPNHKRRSDEAQDATIAWSMDRARRWMTVLDEKLIGDKTYLCGDQVTIADYYGLTFVHLAEVIGSDFGKYPNVKRWLERMKSHLHWQDTYAAINGFAQSLATQMKGQLATV